MESDSKLDVSTQTVFADLDERIKQLKERENVRQEIMTHITHNNWDMALRRAAEASIQLFEDPYFKDQTLEYWRQLTHQASQVREEAKRAVQEARRAIQEAEAAGQKAYTLLIQTTRRLAFTRADKALLELDTNELARQIKIINQLDPEKLPDWIKPTLVELQQDFAWLQRATLPVFQSDQERIARIEELVKEQPGSRLAALWHQQTEARPPQGAVHQEYGQAFAHMAKQIKEGRIAPFLSNLAKIQGNLHEDTRLDTFQRLVYADALAAWRRRIDQWHALSEVIVEAKNEARAVAASPPIARDERLVKAEQLRQALGRLVDCSNNTAPEIFACEGNEKGSTLAGQWQQAVAFVVKQILNVRRMLYPAEVIEQQREKWDEYQVGIQAYANRRREEGELFFELYAKFGRSPILAGPTHQPGIRPGRISAAAAESRSPSQPTTLWPEGRGASGQGDMPFDERSAGQILSAIQLKAEKTLLPVDTYEGTDVTIALLDEHGHLYRGQTGVMLTVDKGELIDTSAHNSSPRKRLGISIVEGQKKIHYRPGHLSGEAIIQATATGERGEVRKQLTINLHRSSSPRHPLR